MFLLLSWKYLHPLSSFLMMVYLASLIPILQFLKRHSLQIVRLLRQVLTYLFLLLLLRQRVLLRSLLLKTKLSLRIPVRELKLVICLIARQVCFGMEEAVSHLKIAHVSPIITITRAARFGKRTADARIASASVVLPSALRRSARSQIVQLAIRLLSNLATAVHPACLPTRLARTD